MHKYEWRFPGGELLRLDRRAGIALSKISQSKVKTPLIVSLEMIGRMLLRHLLQEEPEAFQGWNHSHDVVYQIDIPTRTVGEVA